MLVDKSYQDSSSLQAIYALSNTKTKLFLSIFKRAPKGRWTWILRAILAGDIDRKEKTVTRNADDLEELGLIEKVRHGINPAHECAYRITEFGYEVADIIRKLYRNYNYIVFATCLLLSPVRTNVPRVNLDVCIKEVSSSSSYSKLQTAPARDPKNTPILQTTPRKEVDVGSMEHKNMDMPEHVVSLTKLLQLTTHGQLKLSIFDKETVDYCWAAVQKASGCKDVFKELANLCVKYYEDNERRPDWPFYYDGLKSGFAEKNDRYTSRVITSAMIKPRVVKESNPFSESASYTAYKNRDKSKDPVRWIDRQVLENPERNAARQRENMALIEGHVGQQAPADVLDRLGIKEEVVVQAKPIEWSQTDKQLVDWALNYIGKMTTGKAFYAPFEQEILMGPDSPRARTGELQDGLRLMQRLYYTQIANQVIQEPVEKVVTELKDQIVCAQIANDENIWENLKYSPIEDDEVYEEIY